MFKSNTTKDVPDEPVSPRPMHDWERIDEEYYGHDQPSEWPPARKSEEGASAVMGQRQSSETYVVGATLDAPTRLKENQKAQERVKKRKDGIWWTKRQLDQRVRGRLALLSCDLPRGI